MDYGVAVTYSEIRRVRLPEQLVRAPPLPMPFDVVY